VVKEQNSPRSAGSYDAGMNDIVAALAEQHAELDALLDPLDEAGWQRPTPCPGWTVADVVLHLAQTDELAQASARGEMAPALEPIVTRADSARTVDDGAGQMVAAERGGPGAVVLERWRDASGDLRALLLSTDPHARVTWVAGELSARTLATTRLAEAWIHTGDVAAGLGTAVPPGALPPSDRLWHIARLAWRTIPYAFARAGRRLTGPVAFELRSPTGDTWSFVPDTEALTMLTGDALELCLVAGRRVDPAQTGLRATGPDAAATLELVRTYA
jgi:uncharacterized protein (TIGR03084 family)